MSHIVRSNAGKNINLFFELFIKQKIESKSVLFLMVQTLYHSCSIVVFLGLSIESKYAERNTAHSFNHQPELLLCVIFHLKLTFRFRFFTDIHQKQFS